MKIHIQSDTHVEMRGPIETPAVSSNVTVCCGDIGLISDTAGLAKYFDKIKESTDKIIWVIGNHEFYHSNYDEALKLAEQFAWDEGIYLMDEALGTDNLELDGVTFWGSTLWTDCGGDNFIKSKVGSALNDFYVIAKDADNVNGYRNFHVDDTIEINERTRKKINWNADVVITHHCPIYIKNPKFDLDPFSYAFHNTGLDEQILDSKIKYWIYGHTHHSAMIELDKTIVVSNQHGYSKANGYREQGGYDPALIIEV